MDSVIDLRAVLQQGHRQLRLEAMPDLLLPAKGPLGLRDYEKMFCADLNAGADIFDLRGIDRAQGALIVVRPDHHVAEVLPLDGYDALVGRLEDEGVEKFEKSWAELLEATQGQLDAAK